MRVKKISSFVTMAALLAVLLRAFIPAGYMPDLKTHDAFQMVICTADGAQTVTLDDAFNPLKKSAPTHETAKPCDFSLTPINAMASAAQAFVLLVMAFTTAYLTARKEFALKQRRYAVAVPRGPPVLSR